MNISAITVRLAQLHCAICNSDEVRVWIPPKEKPECVHCGYQIPQDDAD